HRGAEKGETQQSAIFLPARLDLYSISHFRKFLNAGFTLTERRVPQKRGRSSPKLIASLMTSDMGGMSVSSAIRKARWGMLYRLSPLFRVVQKSASVDPPSI
ncbi:MAG TPA: hypothetical protein VNZ47_15280, partial [Candidatus Dormibacteraeota bacterium]|nr:hypothetical protein [Candidatus Dormibacteraeota bacterium]